MQNIIQTENRTIIFNGGDPLPGCPESWDKAYEWQDKANEGKEYILWKFDCGFKLDFDGSILRVSSRFYPPKTFYGFKWNGNVGIYLFDKIIKEKKFACNSLDELREDVEKFVSDFVKSLEQNILVQGELLPDDDEQ